MNIWKTLGINPTNEARAIKKAYAAKSKEVHPEEHPEEFMLLHEAYKQALAIAKNKRANTVVNQTDDDNKSKPVYQCEESEFDFSSSGYEKQMNSNGEPEENDTLNFSAVKKHTESEDKEHQSENGFDFDKAIFIAEQKRKNELFEKTDEIIKQLESLYNQKYQIASKEKWMEIFTSPLAQSLSGEPEFINELCMFLKTHTVYENLEEAIYDAFSLSDCLGFADKGIYGELCDIIYPVRANAVKRAEAKNKLNRILKIAALLFAAIIIVVIAFSDEITGKTSVNFSNNPEYIIMPALISAFFVFAAVMNSRRKK